MELNSGDCPVRGWGAGRVGWVPTGRTQVCYRDYSGF